MEVLNRTTEKLDQCQSASEMKEVFSAGIKEIGYAGFDAFSVRSGTAEDIDKEFNFYIGDYAIDVTSSALFDVWFPMDPVMGEIARSNRPFEYVEYLRNSQKNTSVVWQLGMLKLWRIKRAWAVPLNTVKNMRGMTVYMRGDSEKAEQHFLDTRDEIHLMCVRFMDAYVRCSSGQPGSYGDWQKAEKTITDISQRETDCLHWAARGKTYWEIGTILDISENTVRFHLKNAFVKLGANSRSNAVSIAVREGIIEV